MSEPRYRHEDVSSVPKGWRVRTVSHEKHRVRVAFPPGRREKGAGRLVSILHPNGENPCGLRSSNPQELLILGANPPRRRMNPDKYRVVAASRWARPGESNLEREFDTKEEAKKFQKTVDLSTYFRPHIQKVRSNPQELLVMAANPPEASPNPPAAASGAAATEIYEQFSGQTSKWITTADEPHMPKGDYAQLGELLSLYIKPLSAGQVLEIRNFDGDPPLVVSDISARQMYFFKGNQDISDSLEEFQARDRGNGIFELGEARRIDYKARKEHVADADHDEWRHEFGEENGRKPTALFDSRHKRLLLEGGDYRIEGAWIRN
jgi:hypothetical protein